MVTQELLDILVCPLCKNELEYDEGNDVLICHTDRLRYPVENDIPVMLPEQAEKF